MSFSPSAVVSMTFRLAMSMRSCGAPGSKPGAERLTPRGLTVTAQSSSSSPPASISRARSRTPSASPKSTDISHSPSRTEYFVPLKRSVLPARTSRATAMFVRSRLYLSLSMLEPLTIVSRSPSGVTSSACIWLYVPPGGSSTITTSSPSQYTAAITPADVPGMAQSGCASMLCISASTSPPPASGTAARSMSAAASISSAP